MTSALGPAPLVEVTRRDVHTGAEVVESVHLGHLVTVDGTGAVTHEIGDGGSTVFPRSAIKPFQALLCLELLDEVGVRLDDAEIAIGWASHRAEPEQVAAVRALLSRAGVDERDLSCPTAPSPDDPVAPHSRIAHNCSGKHALFAVTAHALGLPVERDALLAPDGPLQSRLLAGLHELLGPPAAIGVDGCGAPAIALPLVAVARAFRLLASDDRFARVRSAGLAHPNLIAGHERDADGTRRPAVDTALLAAGLVAKRGAEGVLAAGWSTREGQQGGIAAKASDGALRGVSTAVVAHLEALGLVAPGTWHEILPQGGGSDAGTIRALQKS
jgi:L-asparaginase II